MGYGLTLVGNSPKEAELSLLKIKVLTLAVVKGVSAKKMEQLVWKGSVSNFYSWACTKSIDYKRCSWQYCSLFHCWCMYKGKSTLVGILTLAFFRVSSKKTPCNKDKLEYIYAKVFDLKSSWRTNVFDFILQVGSDFKWLSSTVTGRCNDFTITADTQIATNHCTQSAWLPRKQLCSPCLSF